MGKRKSKSIMTQYDFIIDYNYGLKVLEYLKKDQNKKLEEFIADEINFCDFMMENMDELYFVDIKGDLGKKSQFLLGLVSVKYYELNNGGDKKAAQELQDMFLKYLRIGNEELAMRVNSYIYL